MVDIYVAYAPFKTTALDKALKVQYLDANGFYYLFIVDGALNIGCNIDKSTQLADAADFESVFLPTANQTVDTNSDAAAPHSETGSITGTDEVEIEFPNGAGNVTVVISGTWAGLISFMISYDGTNYTDATGMNLNNYDGQLYSSCDSSAFPSGGNFRINTTGAVKFKAFGTVTGTADILLAIGPAASVIDQILGYTFVKGPVTDTELRATPVPVSISSVPLPALAATAALQTTGNTSLSNIDGKTPALGQALAAASTPVVLTAAQLTTLTPVSTVTANAGTNLNTSLLALETTQSAQSTLIGAVTETAPASDTASSGLNGRLQRIAQRVTSLIALVPASLGQKASASSYAVTLSTEQEAELGIVTETAPASDTASSGLNGRLQRIAQRITSLIALVPASLGQKTMANAFAVSIASDQSNVSTNIAQMNGVTVTMGNGASGTGVQRVTIADDSTGLVKLATGANTIGALSANQSVNNAQVGGSTIVASVTGVQDVMPRKRTGSTGLAPNYSASRITTKTTTTVTASTAYISAIAIACSGAGTAWTMVIQNKEGTPKILVPSFTLTVPTTGLPIILQFAEPILMTTGIDIVTGGTTAGTVDVFVTYWQ